ncbi:MAG: hypothetical protein J3K34DRAFT_411111 [Monoraphidium minutum]|nr:MAG: hypothetical protein J3K34DRAFT_411111 [Monoraphidium minutum]
MRRLGGTCALLCKLAVSYVSFTAALVLCATLCTSMQHASPRSDPSKALLAPMRLHACGPGSALCRTDSAMPSLALTAGLPALVEL